MGRCYRLWRVPETEIAFSYIRHTETLLKWSCIRLGRSLRKLLPCLSNTTFCTTIRSTGMMMSSDEGCLSVDLAKAEVVHRQTVIDPVLCPPVSTSPRVAPDAAAVPSPAVKPRLRPVGIVAGAKARPAVPGADGRIRIGLAGGRRMGSSGSHDPEARARLFRGASSLSRPRQGR